MKTLLVTAIGGDVAQAAAMAIRRAHPDLVLIGTDAQTRHGGSLVVDRFEHLPPASASDYVEALKVVCSRHAVNAVLPISEPELARLHAGDVPGLPPLLTAGARAIQIGGDKLATARFVAELGFRAPRTIDGSEAAGWTAFPCILKLRRGSGSKVVELCEDRASLDFFVQRRPGCVIQEYLPGGDEVTCAVYRDGPGDIRVLQLARRLVGGATGWARVIDDERVTALCAAIAEGLDVQGAINVQLMRTPDGPMVFEINPRLSSTVLMRHAIGFGDAGWLVDRARGRATTWSPPAIGTEIVKLQTVAILD
jgi:carbamoyl-phosphate synthase large subunit